MTKKWNIISSQSDVLIKARHSIVAYLSGENNKFKGHIDLKNNEIEDASLAFSLNVNNRDTKLEHIDTQLQLNDFFDINEFPIISFTSTSFQKVNNNINFIKGYLTIKNITKVIELDAELINVKNDAGEDKAAFEITGQISRKDFNLNYNSFTQNGGLSIGQDIKLIANLEFST
jgi:polyisoprenoid-binding protein YceI